LSIHHAENNSVAPTVQEVRGEGVVGEFPLLRERGYDNFFSDSGAAGAKLARSYQNSEGYFCYQSITDGKTVMFAGEIEFVPGSLRDPQGEAFSVQVAAFPLHSESKYLY